MASVRSGVVFGVAVLLVLGLGSPSPAPASQTPAAPSSRPFKSVYGKLQSVDKARKSVVMTSDAGERLAWQFNAAVVAEAARFKPGDPMIVIYRQLASNEKRVTALAFPGTAKAPTYINLTGDRVALRSAPAVGEACGQADAGPVTEAAIPNGGLAEVMEACWCCAPAGETCTPGTDQAWVEPFWFSASGESLG